jgi:DNA topoisomerase-3
MRLFIGDKPSLAAEIAHNLKGPLKKCYGFETGGGIVTWCGHILRSLESDEYDVKYKKWNLTHLYSINTLLC